MSQEKVDRYKQEKANRKQTMRKEKTMRTVRGMVAGIIFAALVAWLGYSAIGLYTQSQPRKVAEVDYTAVDSYLQSLNTESGE